ncbi:MAG: PaaI family thioesterase [Dehalococcoidia bacterium]
MTTVRTGLDVLREVAEGNGPVPMPNCSALLGWEAISLEPGRVLVRFNARDEFCNPQGTVQGGFLAAMLDDAMGPAIFSLLDAGQAAPTLEMKVTYLRPARPGPLVAEGRVAHRTSAIAFLEGTLMREDSEVIATATATARILSSNNGHSG